MHLFIESNDRYLPSVSAVDFGNGSFSSIVKQFTLRGTHQQVIEHLLLIVLLLISN